MSYITFDNNHLYKKIIIIMKQTLQKQLSLRLLMILALFIGVGSNALADSESWVKTALSDLATGDIVVIVDETSSTAMPNDNGTSSPPAATAVTLNAGKTEITSVVPTSLQWEVTVTNGSYQFKVAGGSDYLYCNSTNNGVRVGSNANKDFTVTTGGDNNVDFLVNTATNRYIGVYNNQDWRCYTSINTNIKSCVTSVFKSSASSSLKSPSISPAAGIYFDAQTVSITADEGCDIYYALDDATDYVKYTAPFEVTQTTKISAYAENNEGTKSIVTTTTLTFGTSYSSIAELNAAATATATKVRLVMNDARVCYVDANRCFIADANNTSGMQIYGATDFTAGQILSGSLFGDLLLYRGTPELQHIGATNVVRVDDDSYTLTPVEVEVEDLVANPLNYVNRYVKVKAVTAIETWSGTSTENVEMKAGTNKLIVRNAFGIDISFEQGTMYDITGFVQIFDDQIEFFPTESGNLYSYAEQLLIEETRAYEEAMKLITNGLTYRIYATLNGNKYYLTEDGTLDASIVNSGNFLFQNVTANGSYMPSAWKMVGMRFTNPQLTNGSQGDIVKNGYIIRSANNDRNDWEAQVFLYDGEFFAIRSTNANSSNWGGNTYWTAEMDDSGLPNADYSLTSSYVWNIEVNFDNQKAELDDFIAKVRSIVAQTESYEDINGAKAELERILSDCESAVLSSFEECQETINRAKVAFATFLESVNVKQPIDLTSVMIKNAQPTTNADGWVYTQNSNPNSFVPSLNCAEFWNISAASILQELSYLPSGKYQMTAIAFTRTNMLAVLKAGEASMNIATVEQSEVNSLDQANTWFNNGNGVNDLEFSLATMSNIEIGLIADANVNDHWMVWRSFSLMFYGNNTLLFLQEKLQKIVAEAESVLAAVTGEIPTKALEQFQATINEGKQEYSTPEEYEQVIAKIEEATVNARNFQTVFAGVVSRYVTKRNDVQKLMSANKYEQESGAKDAFLSSIGSADEKYGDAETINDVEEAIDILQTAILDFIKRIKPFEGNDTEAGEPLDITALLDNPAFEEGGEPLTGVLPGWTCTFVRGETATNIGYQPNAYATLGIEVLDNSYFNGDICICHFIEAWQQNSSPYVIGDGKLYQRLSGLPIGKYRLVNDAISVNQWDSSLNPVTGTYIYISSGQLETTTEIATGNGIPEHFEVDFINDHAESLDFGLKTANTTANWIAADNFRIYYVAALSESPGVAALKEALAKYDGVAFGPCDKNIFAAFNNELVHAQEMTVTDIYSSAHSTECIEEINTVQTAYEAVLASVEVYEDYQLAVDEVNERAATTIDAESPLTSDLLALAERLQQNIDAGTAVAEDYNTVDNQINNLENYWSKHFAEEDIQALQVILTKFGDQPAWVNKWNLAAEELTLDGVTNTEGRVTAIQLANRGLTGTVPAGSLTLKKLTTVNFSGNSFSAVEGAAPDNVSLNIRNQKLDDVIDFKRGATTAQDVLAQLPSILCYDRSAGGTTSHFAFSATVDAWNFTLREDNESLWLIDNSQCIYKDENGAVVACRSSYGDASGSTFNLRINFDEGDANFNGEVNIADLQTIINYIFDDMASGSAFNFTAADLFKDNRINVQDVVKEVDVLFAQSDDEAPVKAMYGQQKQDDIHASLRFEEGRLLLESDIPVTALDITVASDQAVSWQALQAMGFTVSTRNVNGGIRIIAYSMSGVEVPVGETAIATTTGSGTVLKATLSDKSSNTIGVYLNSTIPTNINDIDEASLEGASVYDLGGRKVAEKAAALHHLPKGIYVINGKKVIK